MATTTYMAFNCLNPECRQLIKLQRPSKSGVYNVTCPHCGVTKQLNLKGLDAVATENHAEDNSANPVIKIQDDFVVGIKYKVSCPHCHKMEFGFVAEKAGDRTISCPSCKGKCGLSVRNKTLPIEPTNSIQALHGKLILLRKGWLNKDYHLSDGKNVVGRYDESKNSDIAIKSDPTMSRRSIEIEVMQSEKGYSFKLTVLSATNQVLHNNNPLMPGESISLNFGDSIILGKTKFRFDKDV
jgi:DNA-directed RNA polymerase subunit M/transcription elongation factor TFIIS